MKVGNAIAVPEGSDDSVLVIAKLSNKVTVDDDDVLCESEDAIMARPADFVNVEGDACRLPLTVFFHRFDVLAAKAPALEKAELGMVLTLALVLVAYADVLERMMAEMLLDNAAGSLVFIELP